MFIEMHRNTPYVVLFGRLTRTGEIQYDDLGGLIDHNETPQEAACRESREESCNLFNIAPKELMKISVHSIVIRTYISYVVLIKPVNIDHFYHNMKLIFAKCDDPSWKEKTHVTRVLLYDMIGNKSSYVNDINGNRVFIRSRTSGLINYGSAFFGKIQNYSDRVVSLSKNITRFSKMRCLTNTITYTVYKKENDIDQLLPIHREKECGVFIVPAKRIAKYPTLCVELVGFSSNHPELEKTLERMSGMGRKRWEINPGKIYSEGGRIYFKSKTMDKAAYLLTKYGFRKIRGPYHTDKDFHFNIPCDPKIVIGIHWKYAIIQKNLNDRYAITNTYDLNEF